MKRKKRFEGERLRRSIYLLPNMCTAMNLFCGFYAIIASVNGKFIASAIAILIAAVFDNLDGKIARATNATSQFGVEFDSLADLVSFGVAPGLMIYLWALDSLHRIGWLASFLFVVCGALRLARFNTQVGTTSGDFFLGLPIPAGAGMTAVTVLFCHKIGFVAGDHPYVILLMLYLLSFLMVSTIRYNSFKNLELFRNMNFNVLVTAILLLVFIAAQPSIALFMMGVIYIISGPLLAMRQARISRRAALESEKEEDSSSTLI